MVVFNLSAGRSKYQNPSALRITKFGLLLSNPNFIMRCSSYEILL